MPPTAHTRVHVPQEDVLVIEVHTPLHTAWPAQGRRVASKGEAKSVAEPACAGRSPPRLPP